MVMQAPEYLTTKLATFRFQHQYSLRTKIEYRLPKPKTNALKRTFFYSTLKYWNTLGEEKNGTFKVTFKVHLK